MKEQWAGEVKAKKSYKAANEFSRSQKENQHPRKWCNHESIDL
jgi:hypothetical protein